MNLFFWFFCCCLKWSYMKNVTFKASVNPYYQNSLCRIGISHGCVKKKQKKNLGCFHGHVTTFLAALCMPSGAEESSELACSSSVTLTSSYYLNRHPGTSCMAAWSHTVGVHKARWQHHLCIVPQWVGVVILEKEVPEINSLKKKNHTAIKLKCLCSTILS